MMLWNKPKPVVIVGAGRLGSSLAGSFSAKGYNVVVIDKEASAFRRLPVSFNGFQVHGDATDIDVLLKAGINNAEYFIACTNNDNVNSMVAQIASRIYNIPKVYARLNDTLKGKLLEGYNIQPIYPAELSVKEFERISHMDLGEEL